MRRELLFATVASVIIVAAVIIISLQLLVSPQYKPSIEIPPKPMPDFTLIDKDGREFSLSSVKGKPVFLFFGYANCPDICPLVLYKYAYALRNLGGQADDIAFIFITQDPWRDSPETLKIWVDRFDERIIALTGTLEQLEPVWRAYNAPVFYTDDKGNRIENPEEYAKAGKPYFVTHMGFVLVADRDHVLRFALSSEMPQEEYLQAARYVLSR